MPGDVPRSKRAIVVCIQIAIGSLHLLRVGHLLGNPWARYYSSYFSDIVIPFGAYFLLTLSAERIPLLRPWWGKAGVVLVLATTAEAAQSFGYYVLGITFDPLDILMYAAGVLLAALLDVQVFARHVTGWAGPRRGNGIG